MAYGGKTQNPAALVPAGPGMVFAEPAVATYTDGACPPPADLQTADGALANRVGISPAEELQLGQLMQGGGQTWAQAIAIVWPAATPAKLTPSAATLAAWQPVVTARAAAGYYPG